jgi:hypothetical protein
VYQVGRDLLLDGLAVPYNIALFTLTGTRIRATPVRA